MSADTSQLLDLPDIQGLVVRGYGKLPCAAYVLLHAPTPDGLRRLATWAAPRITTCAQSPSDQAMNIALTHDGVSSLTEWDDLPDGFSEPFRTGMDTAYRNRVLGDTGTNDPAGGCGGARARSRSTSCSCCTHGTPRPSTRSSPRCGARPSRTVSACSGSWGPTT